MTNIHIPAGLNNNHIELFSVSGKMMGTHSGVVKSFFELPKEFLLVIDAKMHSNPSTILALNLAGYETTNAKLEKFAECNYSSFDFVADFKEGNLSEAEYHECGFRDNCPMEGIVCGFVKVKGQIITPLEIKMIHLLATEDTLPVIAEKLHVCMNTFELKKKWLYEKLGVLSRARLVAVCYDLQILTLKPCS
jgi:DNA-binding CsgD family transcriptional regulator